MITVKIVKMIDYDNYKYTNLYFYYKIIKKHIYNYKIIKKISIIS